MEHEAPPEPVPGGGTGRALAILIGLVAAALLFFGYVLVRISPDLPTDLGQEAKVLPVPLEIPDFALVDHEGRPFDRSRLEGRWSLLFFGYTYCPDICPLTLQRLAAVQDALPEDTQVVFVSVDPERDSQERVAEYVAYFHPELVGVTGARTEIDKLARAVGAFNRRAEGGDDPESYLVDHAVSLFVIAPEARLHALMQDPHEPEPFLALYAKVQSQPRGTP